MAKSNPSGRTAMPLVRPHPTRNLKEQSGVTASLNYEDASFTVCVGGDSRCICVCAGVDSGYFSLCEGVDVVCNRNNCSVSEISK